MHFKICAAVQLNNSSPSYDTLETWLPFLKQNLPPSSSSSSSHHLSSSDPALCASSEKIETREYYCVIKTGDDGEPESERVSGR